MYFRVDAQRLPLQDADEVNGHIFVFAAINVSQLRRDICRAMSVGQVSSNAHRCSSHGQSAHIPPLLQYR